MQNKTKILSTVFSVIVSTMLVAGIVLAATTVGTNISTDGTLTVNGTSTLVGATAVSGTFGVTGATTATGAIAANGGITVDTSNFTVSGTSGVVTIVPASDADGLTITGTNLVSSNQALQIDATAFTGAANTAKAAIINFTAATGGGEDYSDTNTGLNVEARWNSVTDSDGASFTGIDTNVDNYNVMQSDASESVNGIQIFANNKASQTVGTTRGALIAAKNNGTTTTMANAAELFGGEIYTYNSSGNAVGTNKGLVISVHDADTTVGGAGSVLRGIEVYLDSAKEYTEEQGLLIWTNTAGKTIDSAIKIQSAAGTFAAGLDTSGAVGYLTRDIKLQYGETIDNATDGVFTFTGGKIVIAPTLSATGSQQSVEADATLSSYIGSSYGGAVMGNVMGTVHASSVSVIGGLIGKYNVGTNATAYPAGAVIGEVGEDSGNTADAAFIAIRGGDSTQPTAGAAYAVRNLNSTNGNGFSYGLDLYGAAIGSYQAVSYSVADIRLSNGALIDNSTAKVIALGGTDATDTAKAARVLITAQRTSNAPTVAGDVPENFLGVDGYITGVGALGLGSANTRGIYVDITRPAGTAYNTVYADTQDVGVRVHLTNLATANATSYKMMGLEVLARSKTGGNTTNLIGGYIAATNDSSPGAAGNVYGVQANSHNDGVASGDVAALYANDDSMSATGNNYGVLIDANGSGGIVKEAAIAIKSTTGSWNYGLDLDAISAFNTADIRLSSGAVIQTGATVMADGVTSCATLVKGSLYINTTDGFLYVCDGTVWQKITF